MATVTLSRPEKRNALGEEMLADLIDALASFRDDAETRVVVLSAEPPVFSAGAQTSVRATSSEAERRQAFAGRKSQFRRLFERATATLETLEQVTVAKIGGHAVGAGWGSPSHATSASPATPPGSGSRKSSSACFWAWERRRVSSASSARPGPRRSSCSPGATTLPRWPRKGC